MANTDEFLLGDDFESADKQAWIDLATAALKGRSPDTLTTTTLDGIAVAALHTDSGAADPAGLPGSAAHTRGSSAGGHAGSWDVRQLHADPDISRANASVLEDLETGATSLLLDLDRLGIESAADLDRLLDGVHLDLAGVHLAPSARGLAAAESLVALWEMRGMSNSAATGSLGLDPMGVAARGGQPVSFDEVVAAFELSQRFESVPALVVDATPYADAGASDAQEIAYSLATGVQYLRTLTDSGVSIDDAFDALAFTYSVGPDQFAGIAKLRAARTAWARIGETCGAARGRCGQRQHGVTAASMMSAADPWVNMLRVTVACFAAAIGGAQAITVRPFDSAAGTSDTFARRIARNTQLLLIEESNLARVIDPAGGSWFVEQLTADLADAAWEEFQTIEAAGGMAPALDSRLIADRIATVSQQRSDRAATRRDLITGVSDFPNIDEELLSRPAAPAGPIGGLESQRLAQPFEALRLAASAASPRPTVFLASLGSPTEHSARTGYARSLFEVGGVAGVGDAGFDSPLAVGPAFADSGARIAVICSSDDVYVRRAAATAEALKASGCERIYLAGRPGEQQQAYEDAGVDEFIHVGLDVLEVLGRTHDVLGLGGPR